MHVIIRSAQPHDAPAIADVINDGARAYEGVIAAGLLSSPYMPLARLQHDIDAGVDFAIAEVDGAIAGVMGVQRRDDVMLVRHAYIRASSQQLGIGSRLLSERLSTCDGPVLVGTWADAPWAIRFYARHGFALVPQEATQPLLARYWDIPAPQAHASVVLADRRWFAGTPVGTS